MTGDAPSARRIDDEGAGDRSDAARRVLGGGGELARLLDEGTDDVRGLNVDAFRAWLARQLERWRRDPVFLQRCEIRDVRRANPRIGRLERAVRRARREDDASPEHPELARLEKAVADAGRAIDGLTAAAEGVAGGERERLLRKRDGFVERRARDRDALRRLTAASPTRQRLNRAAVRLRRVRDQAALGELEARLQALQRDGGRSSTTRGAGFEDVAAQIVRACVLPQLADEAASRVDDDSSNRPTAAARTVDGVIRILHGVTLGAAGTEIDQLVVRVPVAGAKPVDALAMVEAKRDINDVAHGFRQRQANLAWLTGDAAAYDPDACRTRAFPTGHFDHPAVHEQDGERFAIDRSSFRRFRRDAGTGLFIHRLWFVTRRGTMWGAGRAAMSRLAHRASTDEGWDLSDDAYVGALCSWFAALTHSVETPDVLRTYLGAEGCAGQILLVDV